jgi:hypothetical protein
MKIPEEGKGVLFINDQKNNPKSPFYKGQMMIDGKLIQISGWKKETDYGHLISLARNTWKEDNAPQKPTGPREVKSRDDDDIPW